MNKELYEKYKHLEDLKPYWGGKSKKITNPQEYLERYFKDGTKRTFFKNGEMQCQALRNRGFYDLYFMTKARFNEITEEELAYYLIEMFNKNELRATPCGDVRKTTFFIREMHGYGVNIETINLYPNISSTKYGIEPSLNEIIEMAKNYEQQQNTNN